jgi:hypothetical protein
VGEVEIGLLLFSVALLVTMLMAAQLAFHRFTALKAALLHNYHACRGFLVRFYFTLELDSCLEDLMENH